MPRKKIDKELALNIEGLSQEDALGSIHAANEAFKKEKLDFDTQEKRLDEEKERTKTVIDSLEVVDSDLNKSTKSLTKTVDALVAQGESESTPIVNKLTNVDNEVGRNSKELVVSLEDLTKKKHDFDFIRNPDGSVNWRKMIKSEHIVFNEKEHKEAIERNYGKPLGELSVDEVDDKYLLVLLAGFKEVAKLRGFKSVRYPYINTAPGFAAVHCEIEWHPFQIGDYYEAGFIQGDGADVSDLNSDSFARRFPTAIAFNRAFVRAVRTSLNIPIVGKDEVGPARKMDSAEGEREINPATPRGVLKTRLAKMGRSFDQFKEWWAKTYEDPDALQWTDVDSIPDKPFWKIMAEFKRIEEEKKGKKG
jgi:hypothetical protein